MSGTEPMEVSWSKGKTAIKAGGVYSTSFSGGVAKLNIKEVFTDDSGEYTLEVKNQWGSAKSTASLQVKGELLHWSIGA